MSGTTVGQWARRALIRASRSADLPHHYTVEDVGEAAIVAELLARGVRHKDIHRVIERLAGDYGRWPLSEAELATLDRRIVLHEDGASFVLGPRGWQSVAVPAGELREVRLRLRHPRGG